MKENVSGCLFSEHSVLCNKINIIVGLRGLARHFEVHAFEEQVGCYCETLIFFLYLILYVNLFSWILFFAISNIKEPYTNCSLSETWTQRL